MKKRIICLLILLSIPIAFFSAKTLIGISEPEQQYRDLIHIYEGKRGIELEKIQTEITKTIPEELNKRLSEQINWMNEYEKDLNTIHASRTSENSSSVLILSNSEQSRMEGFMIEEDIPVLIYRSGYETLFGLSSPYISYFLAAIVFIAIIIWYKKEENNGWIKQLLFSAGVVIIVYSPEYLCCLISYGFSGLEYSIRSVGRLNGGTIGGMLRFMFLMRLLGTLFLIQSYLFFTKLFNNKKRLICIFVLFIISTSIISYFFRGAILLSSASNLLIATNALQYSGEYIAILMITTIAAFIFFRYYPVYHYNEEDKKRMLNHFSDYKEK